MKKTDLHVVETSRSTGSRKVKTGMQRTEKCRRTCTRYYKNILVPQSIFKISFTRLSPLHTNKEVSVLKTSRYDQVSEPGTALKNCTNIRFQMSQLFNHPLGRLSYDRSRASSKANSPHCAIWCSLFQFPVPSFP